MIPWLLGFGCESDGRAEGARVEKGKEQKWGLHEIAALATIAALVLAIAVFVFGDNLYGRWNESEPNPTPVELPVARPSSSVAPALVEGIGESIKPAPKVEATVQPNKDEASSTPSDLEAPLTFPPPEAVMPERSHSEPAESKLSFLLGNWRLSDESCLRTRRFSMTGEVLEVHYVNGILLYSGIITRVDGSEVWMGDNSRFILKGEDLHHVTTQSTDIFLRC